MWLRPDVKTQVSVRYEDDQPARVETVLVSTQHAADASQDEIRDYIADGRDQWLAAPLAPARRRAARGAQSRCDRPARHT